MAKLFWIYAAMLLLLGGFALASLSALRDTAGQLESVITRSAQHVILVERLSMYSERFGRTARSLLLTGDPRFASERKIAVAQFAELISELEKSNLPSESRHRLAEIRRVESEHEQRMSQAIDTQQRGASSAQTNIILENDVQPLRDRLNLLLAELKGAQEREFGHARDRAIASATARIKVLASVAVGALLLSVVLLLVLRRSLNALAKSRAQLEGHNHDLDAFAGRVAHDLSNVITPFAMVANRLQRSASDSSQVQALADRLLRTTKRADRLLHALLAFARGGEWAETGANASVSSTVQEVLTDLDDKITAAKVKVTTTGDDCVVVCPEGLLYTVLLNTVGNAVKYLAGRVGGTVTIECQTTATQCEILISDNGPGIPDEFQKRIFDPFFRVPGARGPGAGIGLATVRRVVEARGGRISVSSVFGKGSTFRIVLPKQPT